MNAEKEHLLTMVRRAVFPHLVKKDMSVVYPVKYRERHDVDFIGQPVLFGEYYFDIDYINKGLINVRMFLDALKLPISYKVLPSTYEINGRKKKCSKIRVCLCDENYHSTWGNKK